MPAACLRFNLPHSGDQALYAVTRHRSVGVDLEQHRPDLDIAAVARGALPPQELTVWLALPAQARRHALLACWTRKEACLKAMGTGLSLPPEQITVSLAPGEPPAVISVRGSVQEAARWTVRDLSLGPGYAAALCVEGGGWRLQAIRKIGTMNKHAGETHTLPAAFDA